MEIIKGKEFLLKNTCVTIGKFDGLHLGHQMLLAEMQKYQNSYTTVMLNFDFSQWENTLKKGSESRKLYTEEQKISCLEKKGPAVLIEYPFDRVTADTSAYDFIKDILIGQLDAKVIVVGENFRFGRAAQGDTAFLKEYEREFGYKTIIMDCVKINDRVVSSTRIRDEISHGNLSQAEVLLNKNYW